MAKNGATEQMVVKDLGDGLTLEIHRPDGKAALVFDPMTETLPGNHAGELTGSGKTRAHDLIASEHAWHGPVKVSVNILRNAVQYAAGQRMR